MENKSAQIKLGLMVTAAFCILVFTVMWGKSIRLVKSSYTVKADFADVTGLEKGARVLVNGIPQGKVSDYRLEDGRVIVEMSVDKEVKLFTDAYAYLESPDLMAELVVAVNPGSSGIMMADSAVMRGLPRYSFSQIFASVGEIKEELSATMRTLRQAANTLEATVSAPGFNRELQNTVNNLSAASQSLNGLIKENQPKIEGAVDNLYAISSRAAQLTEKHDEDVETIIADLKDFSGDLQTITKAAQDLSGLLNNQNSTLGKLTHDDKFYVEMRRAVQNLDSLISEFRKNGVKAKVSLF